MNRVIKDTKKVMEMQSKIQKVHKEIEDYTKSYRMLEYRNRVVEKENRRLQDYIKEIIG